MFHFQNRFIFSFCFFFFLGHLPQSPQMTTTDPQDSNGATPNSITGSEGRITSGYSINGILGIQHPNDVNVNSMKRKRVEDHGEYFMLKLIINLEKKY